MANSKNPKPNHLGKWKPMSRERVFLTQKQKAQLCTDNGNEDGDLWPDIASVHPGLQHHATLFCIFTCASM